MFGVTGWPKFWSHNTRIVPRYRQGWIPSQWSSPSLQESSPCLPHEIPLRSRKVPASITAVRFSCNQSGNLPRSERYLVWKAGRGLLQRQRGSSGWYPCLAISRYDTRIARPELWPRNRAKHVTEVRKLVGWFFRRPYCNQQGLRKNQPTNFLIYTACCCSASNLAFHAYNLNSEGARRMMKWVRSQEREQGGGGGQGV